MRAASICEIGLMDESFFLYCEELEWQLRRDPRHPRAMMLGEGLVLHKVSTSTGTTRSYLICLFMSRNFIKLSLKYARFSFPLWMAYWQFYNLLTPFIKFDRVAIAASIQSLFSLRTPGEELVRSILCPSARPRRPCVLAPDQHRRLRARRLAPRPDARGEGLDPGPTGRVLGPEPGRDQQERPSLVGSDDPRDGIRLP